MCVRNRTSTVLLVEDEVLIRMFIAELLAEAGFEVIEASDAATALKRLELGAEDVQAVFTDVDMPPGMSGLELAQTVHERWPEIGVVVTSAHHRPRLDEIAGCGAFIPKPYEPEVVVEALQRSLGNAEVSHHSLRV
jgi:CheY-like chemotaxis protein